MKRRIISLFLVVSLMIPPFVISTSAVAALPGGVAAGAVAVIKASALASAASSVASFVADNLDMPEDNVQAVLDYLVSVTGYGNLGHMGIERACARLNAIAANPRHYAELMYEDCIKLEFLGQDVPFESFHRILVQLTAYQNDLISGWHVIEHQDYGYVIVNQPETFILADSVGRYPYAEEITDQWLGSRTALASEIVHPVNSYHLTQLQESQATLYPLASFRLLTSNVADGKYQFLQIAEDGVHYDAILCDEDGYPYAVPLSSSQAGSDRDYNNEVEGQPEVSEDPIIDIDGDFVYQMFPDGSFTWINGLTYDASNKIYNIDASTTYNTENNYYHFEWNYTYHIDYTSITYIGATEEYTKTYEYYFDLPDGRSSADLTKEDLLALNTAIDVVPYIRSADDTSIRALYHFDGNTNDSSYWNYLGKFDWEAGASLTYMDSNAFNGALYLDEKEHRFTITLPSNIYSNDFTLQFRYYQSATATPVVDSSVTINGYSMVNFDGANIRLSGQSSSPLSTGSWNEICIIRKNNVQYLYLNGVCVSQRSLPNSFGNKILFKFGSEQQTYKYLDELRFLDYALVSGGKDYTPTSVPHDTNLALVLPDSVIPVADEYWSVASSHENLLKEHGLDYGSGVLSASSLTSYGTGYNAYSADDIWPNWAYITDFTSVTADKDSFAMQFHQPSDSSVYSQYPSGTTFSPDYVKLYLYTSIPSSGIFTPVSSRISNSYRYHLEQGNYTFTLVFDDGEVVSVPFEVGSYPDNSLVSSHGYTFGLQRRFIDEEDYVYYLRVYPETGEYSSGIVYMELVKGTSTDLTAEKVSSVAGLDAAQFKTPTLAVRTDLEITSYQIGGVRPSIPEKGLVWALVEDGRISSLQIYNGQAWEAVDGRIWTGARWVPYYAYDVLLLKDLYDIVEADPSLDYIYTEAGFWAWLQKAWGQMMAKLDQIIIALGGNPNASTCAHVYNSKVDREPGCTEPGYRTYTCDLCGHQYTELIDAVGHDWTITGSVPDVLDEEGNLVEEGYDELTCSICGAESRDYGDGPEERDIFDALGDFIADGIGWILEKLTELANSLQQITEIFNGFLEKVKTLGGGFPLFFGAFMALIPEDLAVVLWFAVIAFVILCVWKKWSE